MILGEVSCYYYWLLDDPQNGACLQPDLQLLNVVAFDAAMGAHGDAGVVAAVQDDEIACEGEDVESRVDDGDDVVLEGLRDDLLLQAYLCRTSSLIYSKRFFFAKFFDVLFSIVFVFIKCYDIFFFTSNQVKGK